MDFFLFFKIFKIIFFCLVGSVGTCAFFPSTLSHKCTRKKKKGKFKVGLYTLREPSQVRWWWSEIEFETEKEEKEKKTSSGHAIHRQTDFSGSVVWRTSNLVGSFPFSSSLSWIRNCIESILMDLLTQRASAAFYFFFFLSFGEKERERPPIEIVQNLKRALVYVDKKIKKGTRPDQTQQSAVLEETQEEAGWLFSLLWPPLTFKRVGEIVK